jgi:polyisoprenoid-binding protein YceI
MRTDHSRQLSNTLFACTLLLANTVCASADRHQPREPELPQVTVEFKVDVLGLFPVTGRFRDVRASFGRSDGGRGSGLNITVCPYSLDTRNAERDRLLRSPLFFDVARFPAIRFSDVRVLSTGDGTRHLIGELTLNGVSKPVAFRVTEAQLQAARGDTGKATHTAQTTIDRHAFGLDAFPVLVGRNVVITVHVDGDPARLQDRFHRASSSTQRLSARGR